MSTTPAEPEATEEAEPQPLPVEDGPPPAPDPPAVEPVVVARWVQLVVLPLAVVGAWSLARASGQVPLIFILAGVIALILNPLVAFVQRGRVPRGLAVLIVYVGLLIAFGAAGLALSGPVSTQVTKFQDDIPNLRDQANERLASLQRTFDDNGIDIEIKRQGETALETLQDKVSGATGDIVSFGGDLLKTLVTAGFGLILTIVLSVYFLIYGERIGAGVRRLMPPGDGTPEDDYVVRVQKAVGGYVRGQLLFSLIMGSSAAFGLWLFGVLGIFPDGRSYWFAFGAVFAFCELIPFVGPILGALPPILVALFQDPLSALWVALLFLALQQLEGHVVAPQIFGLTLRINPLLVLFALLTGAELYGFVGALVALPVAAILRETWDYLRRHLVLEPWNTARPG